jgi:uncharacterized protein YdaT
MKNLPPAVRTKAVEIANALLGENMDEGIAIATGISRAKDWAASRGKKVDNPEKSDITDVKKHGQDRVVIPYEGKWAIKVEGREKIEKQFSRKTEAVSQARREAKAANAGLTTQLKTGKIERKISYNPNNRGAKTTRKT